MRILVLGGTSFVGRAIVDEAVRVGAVVSLFGRGRTGPELFPEVPRLIGDRETDDYAALRQPGRWDAVVDVSGYVPRHVERAMDALDGRADRYLFISSNAVYQRDLGPGADEDAPLRPPVDHTEELDDETYGPLKVACENAVRARYGERATVVRPGQVVGPHDPSDILAYWVRRAARGGRIAVPGGADQPVQVLDSRDLAGLVLRLVLDGRGGAFNALGPEQPVTLGGLIRTCAAVAGASVELVPVPLEAVGPFFPLARAERHWATQQRSAARARAAGMPATPLPETIAAVLAWDRERGEPPLSRGLSPEREAELLKSLDPAAY